MKAYFNQAEYWMKRHRELAGDPRSVGNVGKSLEENYKGEERIKTTVDCAAQLLSPASTVLDLGCGYGRITDSFLKNGYKYHGVDISPEAIAKARRDYQSATFSVSDLLDWENERTFDVVCALYVFVHFVDDNMWRTMLQRALSWVGPSGSLLIADNFSDVRNQVAQHAVTRPSAEYNEVISCMGFRFDEKFPLKLKQRAGINNCRFKLITRN